MKTSDPVSVSVSRNLVSVQHRTPDSLNIVRIRSDRGERETPDLTRVQRVSGAVVPSATSDEFEYRLPADSSIALDADSAEDARIAVTAIGHVLDELHRSGQDMVTSGVPTGPPWIRRLEAHLRELRCAATEVDEILRREIPAEYFDLPPDAASVVQARPAARGGTLLGVGVSDRGPGGSRLDRRRSLDRPARDGLGGF